MLDSTKDEFHGFTWPERIPMSTEAHLTATKQEAQEFLRVQLKRCRVNLENAKQRGDSTAQANILHKIACFEYLEGTIIGKQETPVEAMRECPNCRVYALDIFGHCSCCGKNF